MLNLVVVAVLRDRLWRVSPGAVRPPHPPSDNYRSTIEVEGSIIRGFVNQKWVPYSQRYLFNAIPDTNHNANPTNPNTRYRIIEPSDY